MKINSTRKESKNVQKRDEKGRFMASDTKKQKASGGDAVKILIRGEMPRSRWL